MEGSTRASDASVIPPQSIQIPQNTSEADNTRLVTSYPPSTDPLGLESLGEESPGDLPAYSAPSGLLMGPESDAKNHGEFRTCNVCGITMTSAITAKMHYAGKNHQKKLKARALLLSRPDLMAKADIINSPNKRTVVVPPISQQGSLPTQTTAEAMDAQWSGEASGSRTVVVPSAEGEVANGASANILKCEVCDIDFNSPSHADMHYQGKKHAKKVKLMLEGPTPQPAPKPKKTKEAVEASELFCTLCNVSTTGQIK
ncbi:zinc finger matrin-type protein 3-like isoform X2 [Amphiura filiformis]|uniref:zinc finger matrin-type protein 3-like isoform X2 n=1 Tax=Amphiura filiformis TaxID=82378 RepID=UPI003B228645